MGLNNKEIIVDYDKMMSTFFGPLCIMPTFTQEYWSCSPIRPMLISKPNQRAICNTNIMVAVVYNSNLYNYGLT